MQDKLLVLNGFGRKKKKMVTRRDWGKRGKRRKLRERTRSREKKGETVVWGSPPPL